MNAHALLTSLILTLAGPAPTAEAEAPHFAEAVEMLRCGFEEIHDQNFDGWPDRWTRRQGPQYPAFIKVAIPGAGSAIEKNAPLPEAPEGHQVLAVQLGGRAAAVQSPRQPASSLFSYVLTGQVRASGLARSQACLAITFFDEQGRRVAESRSPPLGVNDEWVRLTVGPVAAGEKSIRFAAATLHVEPQGTLGDLQGAVYFDDLWLARLPRIALTANREHNLYTALGVAEVKCQVSGVLQRQAELNFELFDVHGSLLAQEHKHLEGHPVEHQAPAADDRPHPAAASHHARAAGHASHAAVAATPDEHQADAEPDEHQTDAEPEPGTSAASNLGFAGEATWQPPIAEYGFYRVRVTMRGAGGIEHQRTVALAVLAPLPHAKRGEFGWSLPEGDSRFSLKTLVGLLSQASLNWAKFPAWRGEQNADEIDQLAWFAEKLSQQGIEMVGVLDEPPAAMRAQFGEGGRLPVASIFMEPALWHPAVDPVMTRLSLKVRWWQLGRDDDTSYVGFPAAVEKIREIRRHFDRFGQTVNLGINWHWLRETPGGNDPPWAFLNYQASPALTADELASYLAQPNEGQRRWVQMEPLPVGDYSLTERAGDLVQRMLAAKIGRADAIFLSDPFHERRGLLNADGTPGELFLPWRTAAGLLAGARHVGSLPLPGGSRNEVFTRGQETMMVVWSDRPTTEVLYLGENVKQLDLWGRVQAPALREGTQAIEVGALPIFVTGLSLPVAEWRMACGFSEQRLASVPGQWQNVELRFRSAFEQGVGGEVALVPPAGWEFDPPSLRFRAAPGQEVRETVKLRLRSDAANGTHAVRLDFQITAGQKLAFSAYDWLELGLENVRIELATHLNKAGQLVVEQTTLNQSDKPVSFSCFLYAPNRRRLRQFVFDLQAGRAVNTYLVPDGAELLGQPLWLRAEEIGGERVLNQRFTADH